MVKIVMQGFECNQCGHRWVPRYDAPPKVCPSCKRQTWDKPKAK